MHDSRNKVNINNVKCTRKFYDSVSLILSIVLNFLVCSHANQQAGGHIGGHNNK